ncbi:hypothetical protein H696_04144 [Fonticula alba]|uniref:Uncharacterized protein n=1 Tax=Fonticula alba TaxID=691883 RepID=A0A058Z640_FONAL|nr:hypothetical protein H696_04144 [Fonticula alba]KCV69740.1 hypothetical protein H696_04144 [Fonticula alba]|eukprot:XP_009496305.1 hypothetical protein H696_04144 [Fonticula alba]
MTKSPGLRKRMALKTTSTRMSDLPVEKLLERTQIYLDRFDFSSALRYVSAAISKEPDNIHALELQAAALLELGEVDQAFQVLKKCVDISPTTGHDKFLTLGQLHAGHEALGFFRRGVEVLQSDLQIAPAEYHPGLIRQLSSAFCTMAEIYLTDCCDDDDAEQQCVTLVEQAIQADPTNPEAFLMQCSLRISQEDPSGAGAALDQCLSLWYVPTINQEANNASDEGADDPDGGALEVDSAHHADLPAFELRMQAVKLLLELGRHEVGLDIAEQLISEDDEVIGVWYLAGWAAYLLGDLPHALEFLTQALTLYKTLGSDEEELLEHATELVAELQSKGVTVADAGAEDGDSDNEMEE